MSCSTYDKYISAYKINSRGKEIPLQAWTGLEGSTNLKLPVFKTIST